MVRVNLNSFQSATRCSGVWPIITSPASSPTHYESSLSILSSGNSATQITFWFSEFIREHLHALASLPGYFFTVPSLLVSSKAFQYLFQFRRCFSEFPSQPYSCYYDSHHTTWLYWFISTCLPCETVNSSGFQSMFYCLNLWGSINTE